MRSVLYLLVCLLLVSGSSLLQGEERLIEVKAKKFMYTPNIIYVNRGDTVTIRLMSEDVTHGLYIDGYDIQTTANPGEEGILKFVADKSGRFAWRCSVTCGELHPYMIGYLKVSPNLRFWGFCASAVGIVLLSMVITLIAKGKESKNA